MPKHEEKVCPRCAGHFECKTGDISQCQCYGLRFSEEEAALLQEKYTDCLCRNCLLDIKNPYNRFKEKFFTKLP